MRSPRFNRSLLLTLLLILPVFAFGTENQQPEPAFRLLVFSHTTGFRHTSIPAGLNALDNLAAENNFIIEKTEDPERFSKTGLAPFKAVLFLNTNGTLFNQKQRSALKQFIQNGGGFIGVHSASATEYEWDWYRRLVGAHFDTHPKVQPATLIVENRNHPSTSHLPNRWKQTDEWYNFRQNPRPEVQVLLSLDTDSFEGSKMREDHPIAWCHRFDGGRSWFTGLGHTDEAYTDPDFLHHLLGGILWAAGKESSLMPD